MSPGNQQVTENTKSFNNNNNSFNRIVNFNPGIDEEGRQILQWLSPLEPQQRHHGVRTDRLDGVGRWVLETSEFRKWRDGEDGCVEPVLFCYGNPGVGKTYVSSLVIDSLCDLVVEKDVTVLGLYCDFLAQQEQSATNMLGAMLKQLATRGGIPKHAREAFQRAKKEFGGMGLRLPDMVDMLKKTITSLPRLFICVDALDECTPKNRRELLESLREIVRVSSGARVFLTGRPHIDDEILGCFSEALRIPLTPTYSDIKSYLEMRLNGDIDPRAMDDELRADIMRIILEKVSEIFLLVSLNIDAILSEITLTRRRKKLDELTKGEGLGGVYTETLSRMKAQSGSRSKLGMEVLMWVSHAERPLHADELCHALGVEGSIDLDIRNIPAIETLLACSLGLVTVEKSSSTVRLIHHTLREYLSNNPSIFASPHSIIAEVCLTYLNFPYVRGLSPALRSVPPTAPFVEYASCHWGAHAGLGITESVQTLALRLLDGYDKHISSKMMLLRSVRAEEQPFDREDTPRGFTGLHGAAYFGCVEIIVALLETNKGDVQATDFHGNRAIAWAARRGHEGVVRVLLEWSHVNSDTPGTEYGSTPLLWAAENGHEGVVRMLLEQNGVNLGKGGRRDRTALSLAAQNGHEGVVRVLLERSEVNSDTPGTEYGPAPLSWAAENGHEGVVRILLEQSNINPNQANRRGRTPLSLAAENGHEGVVRILLERNDVNPDKPDSCRVTPLSLASEVGHEGVVRMLLERNDVNPDKVNRRGRTPLSLAARNGHEGVVRMLLERNDVKPDKPDRRRVTPLSLASEVGHEGVVRMLLERNDVKPDKPTWHRFTPLLMASVNGHEGVVRMLLERNDVNPDKSDWRRRTPLLMASANGHEGVVRMLLERNDVNPDRPQLVRITPLSWASQCGHEGVVRMLLERNDVNPNHRDLLGLTPLLWASLSGHEGVVRMLSERSHANSHKLPWWHRRLLLLGLRDFVSGGRELRMLPERQSPQTG